MQRLFEHNLFNTLRTNLMIRIRSLWQFATSSLRRAFERALSPTDGRSLLLRNPMRSVLMLLITTL